MNISTKSLLKEMKKKSYKYVCGHFVVWYEPFYKVVLHISLSKKVGKAVFRNKIKRIIVNDLYAQIQHTGIYLISRRKPCTIEETKIFLTKITNQINNHF